MQEGGGGEVRQAGECRRVEGGGRYDRLVSTGGWEGEVRQAGEYRRVGGGGTTGW